MNSDSPLYTFVTNAHRTTLERKVPGWMRTTFRDECAMADGVPLVPYQHHVYVPASWARTMSSNPKARKLVGEYIDDVQANLAQFETPAT